MAVIRTFVPATVLSGLLWLLLSAVVIADESPAWQPAAEVDGVRLLQAVEEDGRVKVRAVTVLDVPVTAVKAVLDDLASHPDWVPYLVETRELARPAPGELLLHSRFDAPWPARDRDFVYRSRVSRDAAGRIVYRLKSVQSPLMPERDDYIRAILIEGLYTVEPKDKNSARVEFMFHADPRGTLPLWIVNIVQRRFPFQALLGLREQLSLNAAAP